MKKIKALNGYTIYQATKRDENKYNVTEGYFYIYFSSDIRDYGLTNSSMILKLEALKKRKNFVIVQIMQKQKKS